MVRQAIDYMQQHLIDFAEQAGGDTTSPAFNEFMGNIIYFAGMIILIYLARGFFLFLVRQTIIVMSRKIEYDLKNEIYNHYQSLPMAFYRRQNTGDLMARISEDVGHVRMYLGPAIMYGLNLIILFVLVIPYMFSVNVKLSLYALIPLPILSVSIYFINNMINKRSEQIQKSLSNISTYVQEAFSGIRVLKAFAREQASYKQFQIESDDYKVKSLKLTILQAFFFPLMISLIGLSTLLTIYIGGMEVINGAISLGNIAEFILYVNMLTWPVTSLGWVSSIIQRAAASQKRINEFLYEQTDIISIKNQEQTISGRVRFESVHFTYPDSGIKALQDINFELAPGESVAIIGATGSGKSTVANLICRLYDPTQGQIYLDNIPLGDYDLSALRKQIGYVPQDVFLFSDTLRNNIGFGLEQKQEEHIIQAAKDADLYDNILQFKDGLDTRIGERGITLSGGQKQRTSIARALIRKPKILILDDALSAVDTSTEHKILQNLKENMKDKTTIIISHRVSSAKLAEKIIVLNEGQIIEMGDHETLMAHNGHYKELYNKQIDKHQVT